MSGLRSLSHTQKFAVRIGGIRCYWNPHEGQDTAESAGWRVEVQARPQQGATLNSLGSPQLTRGEAHYLQPDAEGG